MSITLAQYVGPWAKHPDLTPKRRDNAAHLLLAVARLEAHAVADGVTFHVNPKTGSGVSGSQYGGFRPQSCTQGSSKSAHKEGLAVDRFDPIGEIDAWCLQNLDVLELCGITSSTRARRTAGVIGRSGRLGRVGECFFRRALGNDKGPF